MKALKKQIGGSHYKKFKIQPWEFIEENQLGFTEGCIIKYICRYKERGGREDLEKIKHYVDMLIEKYYPDEESKDNDEFSFSSLPKTGKKAKVKTTLEREFLGEISYIDDKKIVLILEDGSSKEIFWDLVKEVTIYFS